MGMMILHERSSCQGKFEYQINAIGNIRIEYVYEYYLVAPRIEVIKRS